MDDAVRVFSDARMLEHDAGRGHVERPERLRALLDMLAERPGGPVEPVVAAPVRRELAERVHDARYVAALARLDGRSARLDPDTAVSPGSWAAATLAAGCAVRAVEEVLAGPARRSVALVRPPGHHAERGHAMGFCLLNNVAIAAERALAAPGCRRVLIIDWDVHHGNGTQHAFETRDDVLFVSLHQHPFYPGTGLLDETGRGPGAGFTVNAPLPAGCGDAEYLALVWRLVAPAAHRFEPDLVLVSAGFDAHADDPLGGMLVTDEGFAALAGAVAGLADELCRGRLVLCLEGGYDVDALARSVGRVLDVLGDGPPPRETTGIVRAGEVVERIVAHHARWTGR